MKDKKLLFRAFKTTTPVLLGYIVTGMAMGMLAQRAGYPWWIVLLMSVFMYAGAGQFLGVNLFISGASYLQMGILTFLLNMRHFVYGLSLLHRHRNDWKKGRMYLIHSLTDETYALHTNTLTPEDVDRGKFDLAVGIMDHLYWIAGTLLGVFVGEILPFELKGLDFALSALFIVTAVDQWLDKSKSNIPALIGALCASLSLVIFGADQFLLPAIAVMITLLFALKKPIDKQNAKRSRA